MIYLLEFEIKGLPKMANGSHGHWRARASNTAKWKFAVRDAVGIRPDAPLKKAKLTLTRCSATEPDFDGLVFGFKPIVDGLTEAGIIENDKVSNIGQPTYLWEKAKPGHGKIRVRVEGEMEILLDKEAI